MGIADWNKTIVGIKGAGEMATGVAVRLKRAGMCHIFMMEKPRPLAVRRRVSFCEAIYDGVAVVEGIEAISAGDETGIAAAWKQGKIAVIVDPGWTMLTAMKPLIVIDAIIAKRNLGTSLADASLVIGLGPGFTAAVDVHMVIETMRGHDLGRIIDMGSALADTGIPGAVNGITADRVLRAPVAGVFRSRAEITTLVRVGDCVGDVDGREVITRIGGVVRGLIRAGTRVGAGVKIGDIDPRGRVESCSSISDKAMAIGGAVLKVICGTVAQAARGGGDESARSTVTWR
jgi:xanthine dehydrogenase accessory factor